jgi:hypothetical protein
VDRAQHWSMVDSRQCGGEGLSERSLPSDSGHGSSLRLKPNREEVAAVLTVVFGGRCGDGGRLAAKRNDRAAFVLVGERYGVRRNEGGCWEWLRDKWSWPWVPFIALRLRVEATGSGYDRPAVMELNSTIFGV